MNTIKAIYASQEEVPEKYRDLYEERGGALHLTKIEGLKTEADISRVSQALNNEKTQHAQLKQQWNNFFADRKPEDIQSILDKVPELEAAANGKIDDEKLNAIVEGRLKTKLSPIEREVNQYKTKLQEAENLLNGYKAKEKQRTIYDQVRSAASKAGIINTALDDVLILAERMLEISDDGNVIAKDGNGVTPGVTPDIWLAEMQPKRPHWWPASQGGGAKGNNSTGGFGSNPWAKDNWNITKQGEMITLHGIEKASQMAAAAGSRIGATKPS